MKNESCTPKVSVVIPVYNAEAFLRQCLDSVVNQTLRSIEIICVDDGSSDGSASILAEYAASDPRMKILAHRHANAGAVRNAGIAAATGEYIGFVDSDDWCTATLFEKAYAKAKAVDADVVAWRYNQYDMRTKKLGVGRVFPQIATKAATPFSPDAMGETIFAPITYAPWGRLVRRSFMEQEKLSFQELERTNDVYFCCMVRALAQRQAIVDEVLYTYRTGSGTNLQANNGASPETVIQAWERVAQELERRELLERFRRCLISASANSFFYTLNSMPTALVYVAFFERLRKTYGEHPLFSQTRPEDIANSQTATYFKILKEHKAPLDFLVAQENYCRRRLANEYWERQRLLKSLEGAKQERMHFQKEAQRLVAALNDANLQLASWERIRSRWWYRLAMWISQTFCKGAQRL